MPRAHLLCLPLALSLLAAPAYADDGPAGDDLQKLLNSIPDIQQAPVPEAEKPASEEEESMTLPQYITQVRQAIYANWRPDPKLAAKQPNLGAQLLVKVGDKGEVTGVVAVKLSGDKKFDKTCVAAALETKSVPAPPLALVTPAQNGLLINFVAAHAKQ